MNKGVKDKHLLSTVQNQFKAVDKKEAYSCRLLIHNSFTVSVDTFTIYMNNHKPL